VDGSGEGDGHIQQSSEQSGLTIAEPTPAETPQPRLSRRRLLQVTGGGVAAAAGVAGVAALYKGLASVTSPSRRAAGPPPGGYPVGQFQIADYGVHVRPDPESAVLVVVPPVWNLVITATLTRVPSLPDQQRLEAALRMVEGAYAYAPSGVFALVAYGLPYFQTYVRPAVVNAHLPRMADTLDTSGIAGSPVLLDAIRFPSDPASTVLEANDVVVHLRSDSLDILHDIQRALFERSGHLNGQRTSAADIADLFHVTSVRTGFVGAGLPHRMAQHARLRVAAQIPETAPLFMGFTSTQQQGQAREVAVSFDGQPNPLVRSLTTARPGDYFAGGTALHLSHLIEDLDNWYALSYDERVARMFHLYVPSRPGRVTLATQWLNPNTTETDASQRQVIGHNEAVQRGSRTQEGQALALRVDFNTLDPLDVEGGAASGPTPGVHFLAFTPGSAIFHRSRMGMDDPLLSARYGVANRANGINAFIRTTRRQNFLVPPRAYRAFPLIEL
jgi:hypothetical protein